MIAGITAELYDPGAGRLSGLIFNYYFGYFLNPKATLLMKGKVLFTGGESDDGNSEGAQLFDPSNGIFADTGNMSARRGEHTATLLPDGTVLVAGSSGGADGRTFASAELYDPVTGTFNSTGNMAADRGYHTATLLNDGRVLIAGGFQAVSPFPSGGVVALSSAELYTPTLLAPTPALFSLSGDGRGQGAIWHAATGQIASPDNPAIAGEVLALYTTSLADGGVIPPRVAIGGRLAEILFFGKAPGLPGFNQVNVRAPGGIAPGVAVPVRLTYLGRPSNEVSIGVQ